MRDLFKFVLNGYLQLQDPITIFRIIDLLGYLLCLGIQTCLVEGLSMIEFIGMNLGEELGKLIIHVS